jgi:hypothetical protein
MALPLEFVGEGRLTREEPAGLVHLGGDDQLSVAASLPLYVWNVVFVIKKLLDLAIM